MANTINTTGGSFADMSRFTELRQRLFFLIGALIVYRIGTYIPVPGIDPNALQNFFEEQSGTILSMFNMFSGGALERLSIFALGIFPYISCSIVMQMASVTIPTLKELKKEGESGRRKITQYTRYGTVFLAAFQSFGASIALQNQGVVVNPGFNFLFTACVNKPFDHGAAVIIHSTTKFIGGHGTSIGGIIVDSGNFDWEAFPERQPALNTPDPSYGGAIWTEAVKPLGPIA